MRFFPSVFCSQLAVLAGSPALSGRECHLTTLLEFLYADNGRVLASTYGCIFLGESPAVFALSGRREPTVTRTSQPRGCRAKLLPTGTRVLHVQPLPGRPLILLRPERRKRLPSEKALPQIGRGAQISWRAFRCACVRARVRARPEPDIIMCGSADPGPSYFLSRFLL